MNDEPAIESSAVETGSDLVPAEAAPPTLFRTADPVEVVERASKVADALKGVLRQQGLTVRISGREHVKVEGWTTLGSMLGVVPVCAWTRRLERGWEARVEARTLDGRTIGAAEAQCLRDEGRWKDADDYALRSMAQTRATSKALRAPLGFIVTLAGYAATPAEEMPLGRAQRRSGTRAQRRESVPGITAEQYQRLVKLFADLGQDSGAFGAALNRVGAPKHSDTAARVRALTRAQAAALIDSLAPEPASRRLQ